MRKSLFLLALASVLSLTSFDVASREVPISALPNAGKATQAKAREIASKFAETLRKELPWKYLDILEITEINFIPPKTLFFSLITHGESRAEEERSIKDFGMLERKAPGATALLLSKMMTENLCRDNHDYGKVMRSLLASGITIKYNMYLGDTLVGTATVTKNSKCTVK